MSDAVHDACLQMGIEPGARALLPPGTLPQDAVRILLDAGQVQPALQLLAALLSKRYVVAWLCQCARGEALSDDDRAGAALAEQWVRDPGEHHRRIAYEFATADGYQTLGGWIAAAAAGTADRARGHRRHHPARGDRGRPLRPAPRRVRDARAAAAGRRAARGCRQRTFREDAVTDARTLTLSLVGTRVPPGLRTSFEFLQCGCSIGRDDDSGCV